MYLLNRKKNPKKKHFSILDKMLGHSICVSTFYIYCSSSFRLCCPCTDPFYRIFSFLLLRVFTHDPAPRITQKSRGCSLMLTSSTSQMRATGSTQINPWISSAPSSPSFSPSCLLSTPQNIIMLRTSERLCAEKEGENSAASARASGVINDANIWKHWTKLALLQQSVLTF